MNWLFAVLASKCAGGGTNRSACHLHMDLRIKSNCLSGPKDEVKNLPKRFVHEGSHSSVRRGLVERRLDC